MAMDCHGIKHNRLDPINEERSNAVAPDAEHCGTRSNPFGVTLLWCWPRPGKRWFEAFDIDIGLQPAHTADPFEGLQPPTGPGRQTTGVLQSGHHAFPDTFALVERRPSSWVAYAATLNPGGGEGGFLRLSVVDFGGYQVKRSQAQRPREALSWTDVHSGSEEHCRRERQHTRAGARA